MENTEKFCVSGTHLLENTQKIPTKKYPPCTKKMQHG